MVELARKGRYDKSVAVVQDWLNDSRRDSSHDWLLYQQIAMVYIGKAANKPATRTDSIHAADNSLAKALTLFDERPPKDNDVELFGIGGAYQMLGDVADDGKCMYYEKARRCFERQTSLIKGDYYTAQGTTVPLEPLRAEVRRHLQAINEKYAEAGCQAH